ADEDDVLRLVAVGELGLYGDVIPVHGVLAAVDEAQKIGCRAALVPPQTVAEARLSSIDQIVAVTSLAEAWEQVQAIAGGAAAGLASDAGTLSVAGSAGDAGEFSVAGALCAASNVSNASNATGNQLIRGSVATLRAITVAAAGGHHLGLFGPPGTGKTMAAWHLTKLLPPLRIEQVIETTRVWSIAKALSPDGDGIVRQAPVRSPHHSASVEGMVGGGRYLSPGEISLAHNGLLILDEVAEFSRSVLQALREPLESGVIQLARAHSNVQFPARGLVCITANLCPCGGYGRPRAACSCLPSDIRRYWRKFGGAILDRIPLRVACFPGAQMDVQRLVDMRDRISMAVAAQYERGQRQLNGRLGLDELLECGSLDQQDVEAVQRLSQSKDLSYRGTHHVLQVARTMADLDQQASIASRHISEALSMRLTAQGGTPWALLDREQALAL
ncbi:MAG: ATP-binding protein, partial [Spirochaetaceae bacterium]